MGRRAALLFLVLTLLVGGAFLLRGALRSGGDAPSGALGRETSSGSIAALSPGGEALAPVSAEAAAADESSRSSALGATPVAAAPGTIDLERASWIEGRVVAPLGSPADESLAVIALPRDDGSADGLPEGTPWWKSLVEDATGWTRTPVASDGSFRAPVPEGTGHAALLLDGRFLYLTEVELVACDAGAREVVLEPELGGCIELACSPPPQAERGAEELAGTEVELTGASAGRGFFGFGGGGLRRKLELPAELVLELRALPADHRFYVGADPKVFASARLFDLEVEPGRVLRQELAFDMGARISGIVVDTAGAPVADASVTVELQNQLARFTGGSDRDAKTDAEGRFALRGIRPRRLVVAANADGWIGARSEELRPRDAEEIAGLRLVLDRGQAIAGRVFYPGGAPAVGASVRLAAANGNGRERGRDLSDETDAEGKFELSGLDADQRYDVYASAPAPGVAADADEDTDADEADGESEEGEQGRDAGWRARGREVLAGKRGLELELTAPAGLAGRVYGPDGSPLARFEVSASLAESELARSARSSAEVDDVEGRFLLEGAFEGEWRIQVEAEGMVSALEEIRARVPQGGEELRIDMQLAASVAGRVVDPSGAPVAGADVRISKGEARRMGPGAGFDFDGPDTESDAEGRFRLADLRPGSWRITASNEVYAPSEPTLVELLPGVATQDVVVALRRGGTLTGEIYDASGAPDGGRTILANSMEGGSARSAASDAAGHFLVEHLAPGQYMVMAQPNLARLGELEAADEELDPVDFMSAMKMTSVDIIDGETAHVVLGAPPKNPVRLFGRVTEAGEPVGTGTVMVVAEGRSLLDAWKPARVHSDGTYELVLDEPGNVLLSYQAQSFQDSGIEYFASVPEGAEFRFDLELPSGRIEGVVVGPDGSPLAEQLVSIERETGPRGIGMMGGQNGRQSDADGRFAFDHLKAATYTLRAGGGSFFGDDGFGTAIVAGVVVGEGARVDDVRLRLTRPGTIVGRVLATDGSPVAGAAIFVRDASGVLVSPFSMTTSDGEGRFRRSGLTPGEFTLSARAADAASDEVGPVRVREGDETEAELRLQEGTMLRVSAENASGEAIRVSVSVRDGEGRELASLRSFASMQAMMSEGFSSTEQRVGPLPPGSYEVTATTSDGRSESRTLKLTGKAERKLRLRIGD